MSTEDQRELAKWLASGTRYGIHAVKAMRDEGFALAGGGRLWPDGVDLAIRSWGDDHVTHVARDLVDSRVDLHLSDDALSKVRAMLLLGLRGVDDYPTADRRQALARTYKYPKGAAVPTSGAESFRNDPEITRTERDHLLQKIAERLVGDLEPVSVDLSAPLEPGTLAAERALPSAEQDDDIVIELLEDRWWLAGGVGQPDSVMRHRKVRANHDGVTQFRVNYWYTWRGRGAPVLNVAALGGSLSIEDVTAIEENGIPGFRYQVVFTFPPLDAGQTRDLIWTMPVGTDSRHLERLGKRRAIWTSPTRVVERALFAVTFPANKAPTDVYVIKNVDQKDFDQIELAIATQKVVANFVEVPLDRPQKDRASGIVWVW